MSDIHIDRTLYATCVKWEFARHFDWAHITHLSRELIPVCLPDIFKGKLNETPKNGSRQNEICDECGKTFAKSGNTQCSNFERHVNSVHLKMRKL